MTATPPLAGRLHWLDEHRFRIDDTEFVFTYSEASVDGRFQIRKPPELVASYLALLEAVRPERILELGIAQGGSVAFLASVADVERLVCVELDAARVEPLDTFVAARRLGDRVHLHYGVDQADRQALAEIASDEFGADAVDVVFDDASHLYDPTLASFETLFPRLRPGGLYVIEDWNWEHTVTEGLAAAAADPSSPEHERARDGVRRTLKDPAAPDHDAARARMRTVLDDPTSEQHAAFTARLEQVLADPDAPGHAELVARLGGDVEDAQPTATRRSRPLSTLAIELLVARAESGDVVAEVTVDAHWVTVERGAAVLDPDSFRLRDHLDDHFGLVPPR